MVVLNLISVTCTATPISQDPQPILPVPRQTRIIVPQTNPQISQSVPAPIDQGTPLTTKKVRKYWGGGDDDPLNSPGFIWNKDYMGYMKKFIKKNPPEASPFQPPPEKDSSGFLSLQRMTSLDNLEVDLSKELMTPSRDSLKKNTEPDLDVQRISNVSRRWKPAPTKREQEKWARASKAANDYAMLQEFSQPQRDPEIVAAESREQYFKLKNKLQILTMGIGAIGLISTYFSYSPQIAASYGAGLVGSLTYVRMLGSSVDSLADGARGVVKGAVAQPRLLIPVVLVMIYNRWNGIGVPQYGFVQLELIPMLVGFFTYKIATFVQAMEEALNVIAQKD